MTSLTIILDILNIPHPPIVEIGPNITNLLCDPDTSEIVQIVNLLKAAPKLDIPGIGFRTTEASFRMIDFMSIDSAYSLDTMQYSKLSEEQFILNTFTPVQLDYHGTYIDIKTRSVPPMLVGDSDATFIELGTKFPYIRINTPVYVPAPLEPYPCLFCHLVRYVLIDNVYAIIEILLVIVPLLIAIAYTTLLERKVMAGVQRRSGPNLVGLYGLLQPFADGLKLALKQTLFPTNANTLIFFFSPVLTFFLSLVTWAVVPFGEASVLIDFNVGILYLLAISSLSVYGIIMAGWSSNSKYAFLGSLRSAAQLVSYELTITVLVLSVLLCVGSLNLSDIVLAQNSVWFLLPLFPSFVMFMITGLAETNRAPFDLPEAEAELVSGYNVEYSSMPFVLFFLGEYAHMILMSSMATIFFLGGWLPPVDIFPFNYIPGVLWFGFKVMCILFFFVWVRAAFPRYRYDQLMAIGWKVFIPLSFGWFLFVAGVVTASQEYLSVENFQYLNLDIFGKLYSGFSGGIQGFFTHILGTYTYTEVDSSTSSMPEEQCCIRGSKEADIPQDLTPEERLHNEEVRERKKKISRLKKLRMWYESMSDEEVDEAVLLEAGFDVIPKSYLLVCKYATRQQDFCQEPFEWTREHSLHMILNTIRTSLK